MATMEELADQVAHATTGKDVRGAIAEGFGQFDQVKGEVFRRVKAVEDDNATLNARVDELSDDLAAEAKTRYGEDVNLQGQINALRDRLSTDEGSINDLQKRIASLEDQVKKLNEIIFGMEYINDTDEIPLDDSMTSGNDVEVNDAETVNDDEAEVRTPDHDVLADEVN